MTTKLRDALRVQGSFKKDFPGAANLIRLTEGQAERLGHMAWHRTDLSFALQCIELLENMPPEDLVDTVEAEALWRSAIVHYCKCFGAPAAGSSSARRQLDAPKVHGKGSALLTNHWDFMRIRNKQVVHDEGVFSSSAVFALIAPPPQRPKVANVIVAATDAVSLVPSTISQMAALVRRAAQWVESEYQALVDGIAATLEQEPHENLLRTRTGKMRFAWEKGKRPPSR